MTFRRGSCALVLSMAGCCQMSAVEWTEVDFGLHPVAVGAGPRALGMGGAFTALADDSTATSWNPAGLTICEQPEVAASGSWYQTQASAQGSDENSTGVVRLDHASCIVPFFALGCQQSFGVVWQRQYDYSRSISMSSYAYEDFGFFALEKSTTQHTDQDGSLASLGASWAVEMYPGVSVGITANTWADDWTADSRFRRRSEESSTTTNYIGGIPVASELVHIVGDADYQVASGYNVVLGCMWHVDASWSIAAVYKPKFTLDMDVSKNLTIATTTGGVTTTVAIPSDTDVRLTHPSSLTVAAAWRHLDDLVCTLDVTATRWQEYTLDEQGRRTSPVSFVVDPSQFDDLLTVRLGCEYFWQLPRYILVPRIGALIEDLPAVSRAPSVADFAEVDASRDRWYGGTLGLSVFQRSVIWDAAIQVRYGNDVGSGQFTAPDRTVDITNVIGRAGVTYYF